MARRLLALACALVALAFSERIVCRRSRCGKKFFKMGARYSLIRGYILYRCPECDAVALLVEDPFY